MMTAKPTAANGVSIGTLRVAAGTTRPTPAASSAKPMNRTSATGDRHQVGVVPHSRSPSRRMEIVQTPLRAPDCPAYAERFVRSIEGDCLSRVVSSRAPYEHDC
jgi:hypothetical protein